jgi:hypothetical protein
VAVSAVSDVIAGWDHDDARVIRHGSNPTVETTIVSNASHRQPASTRCTANHWRGQPGQQVQGRAILINPADADERGIADGDIVRALQSAAAVWAWSYRRPFVPVLPTGNRSVVRPDDRRRSTCSR